MDIDYHSAQKIAASWVEDCVAEVKRQWGQAPKVHQGAIIETHDDVISTLEVGGALIEMAVYTAGSRQYQPVLIVTEKVVRQHRVGIGHQHMYNAMQSGKPNFKKAVKNAVGRAKEIQDVPAADAPVRAKAVDTKAVMTEELRGVRIPPDILLERRQDGYYVMHCGSIKLTLDQVKTFCKVIHSH